MPRLNAANLLFPHLRSAAAERVIKGKKPELLDKFVKNCGFGVSPAPVPLSLRFPTRWRDRWTVALCVLAILAACTPPASYLCERRRCLGAAVQTCRPCASVILLTLSDLALS
jgi:hypothetical protein